MLKYVLIIDIILLAVVVFGKVAQRVLTRRRIRKEAMKEDGGNIRADSKRD